MGLFPLIVYIHDIKSLQKVCLATEIIQTNLYRIIQWSSRMRQLYFKPDKYGVISFVYKNSNDKNKMHEFPVQVADEWDHEITISML